MNCPNCGTENLPGSRFCNNCGERLAVACPNCGTANQPGARFCNECGTALGNGEERASDAGRANGSPAMRPASVPGLGVAPTPVESPREAERRLVTILFADLVGFTPFAEERDAEEVRETLSRYFEIASEVIGRYGGTIEKFIGDAVMAVWGAPTAHEDDAERAVRAGLELVDAVRVLGEGIQARAGVLTGEERDFIQRHTIVGERIVSAAPALAPVARLVRSSHEWMNGTGYPDRLAGVNIPLGSRIIAVCDAFDAMISPRPYRVGVRTTEQAMTELHDCSGTQFDPAVVSAFAAVLAERGVASHVA